MKKKKRDTFDMKPSQEIIDSLVIRSQKGDVDAFSLLYNELIEPVFRFCFFKVHSREIAEDISSEVFLSIWKNLNRYTKTESLQFSSWVFRIAHNKVMDYFRKNKEKTLELKEELEISDTSFQDAQAKIENEFLRKELSFYLSKIPTQQSEAIILKYFSELNNSEISEIMNKSETAVRILQSRGIKTIREFMEHSDKKNTKKFLNQ